MTLPLGYELKKPENKAFDPMPPGMYQAAIRKIELKKDQPVYQKPNEVEDVLEFEFEVVETGEFLGRKLWQKVRPIMSAGWSNAGKVGSPSWLYKLYCAVNKINLSDAEAKATDANSINAMIGKQVCLIVKQKPDSKGNIWNRITDMLPIKAAINMGTQNEGEVPVGTDVPAPTPSEDINVEDIPF